MEETPGDTIILKGDGRKRSLQRIERQQILSNLNLGQEFQLHVSSWSSAKQKGKLLLGAQNQSENRMLYYLEIKKKKERKENI